MTENKRPLIFVSNDDGITAKGISHLVNLMQQLGDVLVVAPNSPQSGMGHAITINDPLRYYKSNIWGEEVEAYECSGTPADCVKLAKNYLNEGRVPDLVVSGINHGSNASVSVLYSGTMSAAIEASIEGLPSIGFSLCDYSHDADFSHTDDFILEICRNVLEKGLPEGITLNVNFPPKSEEEIKGIKYCRQSVAKWQEAFDQRQDPYNREYLWLTGKFVCEDKGEGTDIHAIDNNYVSVVPVTYDMTAYKALKEIEENWSSKG
ncbi:5'/3'-nucleotidase SurE [Sediminitomix flava]|uniref:5'-nucleotidase SurE n=1 Tax=Sediminitomix flava TaxID=379075 RepID=A0A315ZEC1_SEDFL|nr:5'/3'-nucleotidase SurE [Sediminitomix flava]PWJ43881.1 5'-nucleotidase /3'-nucleotidase /exopolyphosphatase [Sediminitomix flava]